MTSMFPGTKKTERKPMTEKHQWSVVRRILLEQVSRGQGLGAPAFLDRQQRKIWTQLVYEYQNKRVISADGLLPKGETLLGYLREGKSVTIAQERIPL